MNYYTPSVLFRQNAMTKTRSSSAPPSTRNISGNWMYKEPQSEILNKTATNTTNIASKYWNIPDEELFLTSIAVNKENPEQIAISSGKRDSNLFIYDMDYHGIALTHQQTISLPHIQSLEWLSYDKEESTLLTGHRNGTVHIVSVPDSNSEDTASIIKRFNHKRHFSSERYRSLSVDKIAVPNWIANKNNFISSCNESVFMWDMQHRSDLPILKVQHLGLMNFDCSPSQNGIIALCGEFGIALNDLRVDQHIPSIFSPREHLGGSNMIKWAPYDSNLIAASHMDGTVRLWDIRAQKSFGKLECHSDMVTCLEWSESSPCDLYTGSKDGSVVHWDLDMQHDLTDCCLRGGIDSIKYMGEKFVTRDDDIYATLKKRQCGTLIPASKTAIVGMTSASNMLMSIDSSALLGVHDKRGVDSFMEEQDMSEAIIDELLQELPGMNTDTESIFDEPMDISRSTTAMNSPMKGVSNGITNFEAGSVTTLVDPMLHRNKQVERKVSGSTLNSDHHQCLHDVEAAFTYEKIQPLGLLARQEFERMTYI